MVGVIIFIKDNFFVLKKWVVAAKKADFNAIAEKFNISPMLARIMRNRDVIGDEAVNMYLNGTVDDMHDPYLMKNMDKGVMLLTDAIRTGRKIFVIGDYDIDGICSSYILKKGIGLAGGIAKVRLPDRAKDGYGMNMDMVYEALEYGASLILTCDNGISAYDEIRYAKDKGLTVIVTDHHEVPFEEGEGEKIYRLPPADAVIDPKQEDCDYPFKEICGAMIAYKLIKCLFEAMDTGSDILDEMLMFAGFATVGDIMDLKDENRIAVRYALDRMKTTDNMGMRCLIDVTGVDRGRLSPYIIGFVLGPCINATGRLDTAGRALEMFLEENHEEALKTALELKSLNDSRKDLTEKFRFKAEEIIDGSVEYEKDKILVVHIPDCHESLAGIIAGRIREKYGKPAFVLTGSSDGVKGSGRSTEAYDMFAEMTKCRDLLDKFGGHKMAAGLSMKEENIELFRRALNDNCELTEEEMQEKLTADIALPLSYATYKLARELDLLEPYGKGNPKPLFVQKDLIASDLRVIGKNRNALKLKLRPADNSCPAIDSIIFGEGDKIAEEIREKKDLAVMYELDINEYMGNNSVQLRIKDYR